MIIFKTEKLSNINNIFYWTNIEYFNNTFLSIFAGHKNVFYEVFNLKNYCPFFCKFFL